MNLLQLSWRNLIHHPLASSLSLILFALGIGLVSLLFLLQSQLQNNFEKNLASVDLVVGAKGSPLQLILSSMYHIDAPTGNVSLGEARPFLNPKHPLIEKAIPLSLGDSYQGYRIVGTDQNILGLYGAEIGAGKTWEYHFEAVIGATVAADPNLKLTLGSTFKGGHGLVKDVDLEHTEAEAFEVVGILKPTGTVIDQLILTTTQSFWLVHAHEEHEATSEEEQAIDSTETLSHHDSHDHEEHDHKVTPKPLLEEEDENEITALLLKFKSKMSFQSLNMLRGINENTDLQAASPAIEINRLFDLMSSGEEALRILAFVIVFVSGLSIFISLFSSLRERKYELALMRVMGASRTTLLMLIVLEGLLLAFVGYLIGIALSHGGMQLIAGFMQDKYRYSFTGLTFLKEEVWLFAGALLIGLIAAILPAVQAARTDISDTLVQQ
ncbi:MAG: ABC transporter permease [Saprospiraceae bacterium]|nr:ABC transporter permease [Saprospiraceae bacterium]